MARIVVGGHTRNIGKTQLVVDIIRAFPEAQWTAVKITQFGHGICSINGKHCDCAVDEHRFAIQEERDPAGRGDTCRFLAAGARQVFWVRTKQGRLAEAMPLLQQRIQAAENVVLESNSVLEHIEPDLYLPVLDFSQTDFKASAREFLDRAHAFVLRVPKQAQPAWDAVSLESLASRPVFVAWPEQMCPPSLQEFIRHRVFSLPGQSSPGND